MRDSGGSATVPSNRGRRFMLNVMWNWLGTAVSLFIGFVLSPYLILKLGPSGYGVWAITFSLIEYYWFFDFGFRSATVKFVAHYSALDDPDNVRAVINTALIYSSMAATLIFGGVIAVGKTVERFFQVPESLRANFHALVILITLSWCLGLVFNVYNACIEAVQRFEYSTKASIVSATLRAVGWAAALYLGYGLIAIGVVSLFSQAVGYAVNYAYFRRIFPEQRISPRCASLATLREMARFGIHTFVLTISNQLNQGAAPLLIGHFLPAAFVGFYNLPVRLLQYLSELVGRIGIVTNTNAAELAAREDSGGLAGMAVYVNRYCLVIFMPLAILLWTHGPQLLALWVGQEFASQSAPVLAILLAGCVIGVVGQFSASMLLQGLGKHQAYARSLLVEAALGIVLLLVAIPRWGIVGAAWVVSTLMILNRGVFASHLISRTVGLSFARYVQSVFAAPLLVMLPVAALSLRLRSTVLPGNNWIQLFTSACILGASYYALAFFFALERAHRTLLTSWIFSRWNPIVADGVAHG